MRQVRECWSVLARKAADQVQQWQNRIAQSQSRVDQLQASLQRLNRLYAEYRERQLQPQPIATLHDYPFLCIGRRVDGFL